MLGQGLSFEWNTIEDEFRWRTLLAHGEIERPTVVPSTFGSADRWLIVQLMRGMALISIALMSLSGTAASPSQVERIQIENEIRSVLRVEEQAQLSGNQSRLDRLIDHQTAGAWRRIWRTIPLPAVQANQEDPFITLIKAESLGDLVMAEVSVNQPAYGWSRFNPYWETRFYRSTGTGWLRTIPDDEYWGDEQVMETDLLRFEFRSSDAGVVEVSIDRLDQLYATLHEMLQLERVPLSDKPTFVITPRLVTEQGGLTIRNEITSPKLSQLPSYLSREEYLIQSVMTRMTYLTVNRRISASSNMSRMGGSSFRWRNMQSGLRSWLQMELLSPVPLRERIAIETFEAQLSEQLPLTLRDVSEDDVDRLADRNYRYWQIGAAISVIEFMVDAYGDETLPFLVRGLQSDRRWRELIPYVADVSAVEFEAQWNRHLAKKLR